MAWHETLVRGAGWRRCRRRSGTGTPRIKAIWDELVEQLDDTTFYGFLAASPEFRSFRHREVFGQVGFGTGGWDTDYPNSILEILRVVYTAADDDHRSIVGGSQQVPMGLCGARARADRALAGRDDAGLAAPRWPALPAVTRSAPDRPGRSRSPTPPGSSAPTGPRCSPRRADAAVPDRLRRRPVPHRPLDGDRADPLHGPSKLFCLVDRPFWKDVDPQTGRHGMSMTLPDRMTRGTYLLDQGEGKPGLICLSYTWADDSLKWLPLSAQERMDVMLASLREIYPDVDLRRT